MPLDCDEKRFGYFFLNSENRKPKLTRNTMATVGQTLSPCVTTLEKYRKTAARTMAMIFQINEAFNVSLPPRAFTLRILKEQTARAN